MRRIEKFMLSYLDRKKGRIMRQELKKLPYAVRRTYVKFFDLKQRTELYRNQATRYEASTLK